MVARGEHRVVNGRIGAGEVEIGVRNSGQRVPRLANARASGPKRIGELIEPVDGDSISDVFHTGEVLVQHGLAVFDLGGQPTRGDGVPSFGLGQPAGCRDDQLSSGRPLALTAILDGHTP